MKKESIIVPLEFIPIENGMPNENELIFTYHGNGRYRLSKYKKILTWKGYRKHFVNIMAKFNDMCDDVTHYAYFMDTLETYKKKK